MIGILIIAHQPLATAMLHCTRHIYGRLMPQVAALDVIPDEDPELAAESARSLAARINDGSGVLVVTDVKGATPSRIATQLVQPSRVVVLAGANLPLLLRAMTYRKGADLDMLIDKLLPAARDAIEVVPPDVFEGRDDAVDTSAKTLASDAKQQGVGR